MNFATLVGSVCFGILSALMYFYFLKSAIVSGIKQAFKEMEAETQTFAPKINRNEKFVTKSGSVYERKPQQN